jgi:hypothetical protein
MRKTGAFTSLGSPGLIVMASFLAILQLVRYARVRATFPTGMTIAGIPIAGLEFEAASQRLVQVYMAPIELKYGDARIQVRPATLGFELQINNMLAAADKQRTNEPFWSGFWNFLWNRPMTTTAIPLQARFDEKRIQDYLENEISIRYDIPATHPCQFRVKVVSMQAKRVPPWIIPSPFSESWTRCLPIVTAQSIWRWLRPDPKSPPLKFWRSCSRILLTKPHSMAWLNSISKIFRTDW